MLEKYDYFPCRTAANKSHEMLKNYANNLSSYMKI